LDVFLYLEHVEKIADSHSQPPTPPLPRTESYPGIGAPLSDGVVQPWERDAPGCRETNLQNSLYYPVATCEEYKSIQCGINKQGMKRYYDHMLKEENTTLRFPSLKYVDCI
jgi:hypothetical protein